MEEYIIYILFIIIIITVVTVILIIVFNHQSALGATNRITTLKDINTCLQNCDNQFEACQQACDNLGPDCNSTIRLSCSINQSICSRDCYPSIYTVRNGSVYTLNYFNSQGTLLGTLAGWSPNKITVHSSDFPITACVCNPINQCDCTNDNNGVRLPSPGCYIVWFFDGFYSTSEICYTG